MLKFEICYMKGIDASLVVTEKYSYENWIEKLYYMNPCIEKNSSNTVTRSSTSTKTPN